ncbi:MAG: FliJ family protein [Myxococcaceae bacterium]|nr:FliJ family protein [Myxococcaceae bacterium]
MPPYRLQTLLEMREAAEEEAKQAFSDAVRALAKEQAALKKLEDDLERRKVERKAKVQAYMSEVMKRGVFATGMTQMNRFEQKLKDDEAQVSLEIERQKETVRQAELFVEVKRTEMAEAAKDKKAIEKHKDTWKKEVKKVAQDREDMQGEEIGNALHLARTRKQG